MKLTENCRQAMIGLALASPYDEWYASFKKIAMHCDLHPSLVRRAVRLLARKGLAEYANGLTNDDGEFAGAGYRLTEIGWQIAREYPEWKESEYA